MSYTDPSSHASGPARLAHSGMSWTEGRTNARWGDSRKPAAPAWQFSSDQRPQVGTSKTYQGSEVERHNDSRIGWSPGPQYYPRPGLRVGTFAPSYPFGLPRVHIDKRLSPAPNRYEKAQAPMVGPQRVDSKHGNEPLWGFGTGTRDHHPKIHLANYHSANLPSHILLGGHGRAVPLSYEMPAAPAAPKATSHGDLRRTLAAAAEQAESDPLMAAALATLQKRVATLRAAETSGTAS